MSKTYILEPVEVTFEEGVTGMDVPVDDPNAILDAISEGTVIEFSGTKLKFAGRDEGTAIFTPDGTIPEYEPEHLACVNPPIDSASVILITYNDHGTFTVSIYTEDDSDSKPYIDEKLSKNVTYTDHPHNNWEEVLSKKGDPKTGYNTIEKLASSTSDGESSSGGSDDGSSGGAGINILHGEFNADANTPFIRITDAGPFDASDDGDQNAVAFCKNLATKQTFVVFNINWNTYHWPVIRILVDEASFYCIGGNIEPVKFTLKVSDNLMYFVAYLSQ